MNICSNCKFYRTMINTTDHLCDAKGNSIAERNPVYGIIYPSANIISRGLNKNLNCEFYLQVPEYESTLQRLLKYLLNR